MDYASLLQSVERVLDETADLRTRPPRTWSAGLSPATDVDRVIEDAIVTRLRQILPGRILGEESGWSGHASEFAWVVDPIDGTLNHIAGSPDYGTSIALLNMGNLEPVLGVVDFPIHQARFSAVLGSGASLNGIDLRVTRERRRVQTRAPYIAVGVPSDEEGVAKRMARGIEQLISRGWVMRQSGSSALDVCRVAAGTWDAYFELQIHVWDVAAARLVALEAGAATFGWPHRDPVGADLTAGFDFLIADTASHLDELGILLELK